MTATSAPKTFIYGLCDPLTQQLRYIGKSNDPSVRNYEHTSARFLKSKTHKNHWIKSLQSKALRPELFIIEEVLRDGWQEDERFWIAYFKSIGANLTNSTAGGEGDCGPEGRMKQAAALRGRKQNRSAEHVAKIILHNREMAKDPKWRAKISARAKERVPQERERLMEQLRKAWSSPRTRRYECSCVECGTQYVADNTRKKYCSARCYLRGWKRRKRCQVQVN